MKNTFYLLLTVLMVLTAKTSYAQTIYQIIDDKIVMTETLSVDSPDDVPSAFANFVNRQGGCVKGTYFSGEKTHYTDILTPILFVSKYAAEARGVVHIDISLSGRKAIVTLTSDAVNLFFSNTRITRQYNPATNYPVSSFFKQENTYLDQDDVLTTFNGLIKTMRKLKSSLCDILQNAEKGVYL